MKNFWKNKDVLITGGAGSIGSAIVKELIKYNPKKIRVLDINENAQFFLQQSLKNQKNIRYLMGDIRDRERLKWAMKGVNIVIHTAALKHVPSCEYNASEAIETNLIGLNNVIKVANEIEIEKFIYISTDKAVNPNNVMGTTKLLGEKLINNATMSTINTKFSTVRFGNVLNSNGSVIPVFKKQIQKGGPITITHPDMTRFFMSIKDAVQLILKVAKETNGGETYILKMKAFKIKDLAEVLSDELSTKKLDFKHIGMRPGEKLHELLLTEYEKEVAMHNKDMFAFKHEIISPHEVGKVRKQRVTINPKDYNSREAIHLTKEEIRQLLKKERIV